MPDRRRFLPAAVCWILASSLIVAGEAVRAAEPVANANEYLHVVRRGDTLWTIAQAYLRDPLSWPQLSALNGVADPYRLLPGTSIRIPHRLMRGTPVPVRLRFVSGSVELQKDPGDPARPALSNTEVSEGGILRTGADGFVMLELSDGSRVRVPADSEVHLERLRKLPDTERLDTVIRIVKGKADASVPKQQGSRFEVHSPLAIVGVRGTQFGVAVGDGEYVTSDVLEGRIEMRGTARARNAGTVQVDSGQGARMAADGRRARTASLLPAADLSALPTVQNRVAAEFDFAPVAGAVAYRVQVAQDEAFDRVVANGVSTRPGARFADIPDGNYHVGIRAIDASGIEGRPAVRTFQRDAYPVPPITQWPEPDGRSWSSALEFSWAQVSGIHEYRLQVASDPSFTNPLIDEIVLRESRYRTEIRANGNYYWRLASIARNEAGEPDQGPFGDARAVFLREAPVFTEMAQPTENGGYRFAWEGDPQWRYRFQMAADENFATVLHNVATERPQVAVPWLSPGTYYLRVQAIDADGLAWPYSPTSRFTAVSCVVTGHDRRPVRSQDGLPVCLN